MGPKDIDYDVFASGPYCVYCTSSRDGRHWSQPKPIQPRRVIPLAVLGKLPEAWRLEVALGDVIQRLEQRLQQEASGDRAERLLTAAYILTGLRLPKPEDVSQLFRGVSIAMR